jgi:mannosyltransferase
MLIAGGVLRFATLGSQSFWLDEAIAIDAAHHSIGGLFDSLVQTEGNPPLYFLLLDGWMRLFGDSEAATRSLSALFGTATIVVAYMIGRELAGSARVGIAAAVLVAFNPFLIWFSQETRPYALLVLLGGLSFLFFARVLEDPGRRALIGWSAASALAIATHYFAVLLVLPEAVWLLYRVRPWRRVLPALAGIGAMLLALVPLVAQQGQVQDYSFVKGEGLWTRVVAQVPKQWLVGYDAPAEEIVVALAALLTAAAVLLAVLRAEGRERRALRLGAGMGVAALVIALLLALLGADYYLARYLLAAWLPLALVTAAGLGARRVRVVGVGMAVAVAAIGTFVAISVASRKELQRDDWRGIARTLGPPKVARAILVQPIHGSIPLRLYMPGLKPLPPAGATVGEIVAVAIAPREAGKDRHAPAIAPHVRIPLPFVEVGRKTGRTYTVVAYRSRGGPVFVSRAQMGPVALESGTPDYTWQVPGRAP